MTYDGIMMVALAFMESHSAKGRTLTAEELRRVARYFRHPRRGEDIAPGQFVIDRWPFVSAEAVRAWPRQFTTLAEGGEVFRCADYGCPCGWSYRYAPYEPMAAPLSATDVPAGQCHSG
ncbi:hypothetical protein PV661_11955 [Streptomyces sp. MD20-1-1]|uniref:hypothetical protein n=1 Tax=Streptomyces sp. MD20-1-1 TaxID=3028668 RepID=UPI0029B882AD|nr:hypothetical protein [Streptomyces sp. MD20-1-1]